MNKKRKSPIVTWSNVICLVFMLAMVAVLFIPAWSFEEGTLSIAEYIAFPTKKVALLRSFKEALNLPKVPGVNDVVTYPVLTILVAVFATVSTYLFNKAPVTSALTFGTGVMTLIAYLTIPYFALGTSHIYLIIAAIAAIIVGLASLVLSLIFIIKRAIADSKV